jgi:alpha-beta hydrolase superfamily lysophospholipase
MHGYLEHCARYRELANVVTDMGIAVLSYDMRGHGRSDGQRGYTQGFRRYLDDMDAALAELDRRVGDASVPRFLLGHSNGALVALRALADPLRRPARLTCAVVSSPFLGFKIEVPVVKGLVGTIAGRIAPTLALPSELKIEDLTHDEGKLAERRVDTLCIDSASARWFTAAQRAHEYVADNAQRIDLPTLWLVAGGDRIADPAKSRRVRSRLRAASEYHEFADMHHEVFNEVDRAVVFGHLRHFLEDTFPQ